MYSYKADDSEMERHPVIPDQLRNESFPNAFIAAHSRDGPFSRHYVLSWDSATGLGFSEPLTGRLIGW